jgi:hypothetical protein
MILRHALLAAVMALALVPEAQAQLVGNDGWSYQAANRSFHAQGQLLRRQYSATGASSASSAGSMAAYSSTTIGNLNQISQILGDGANGSLDTNSSQTNTGSQTSTSTGGGNGGNANSTNGTTPTGSGSHVSGGTR